jgi:putative membrane protein
MGMADLVPGVSGGTVALVLGIYRHLIDALHTLVAVLVHVLRADFGGAFRMLRLVPWLWLMALGTGILSVVILMAGPLTMAIETYPVQLAGLFVGLIAAAVVLCWRQLRRPSGHHVRVAAVVAVATFLLLGLSPAGSADSTITAPIWGFYLGGAIAVTAMILPGISGSFLLVLMGLYAQVLTAITDRDLLVLGVFTLGCVTGLALSATTLRWLLLRYHDVVLAAMIGLMVGSLRILWPWPGGFESTTIALPTSSTWAAPTALAALGLVLVLGLDALAARLRSDDVATAGELPTRH